MTQDLKDELAAAYAGERFTLTTAEIEARAAGRGRAWARPAMAMAGVVACAAVGVVVISSSGQPLPAASPPAPSASADADPLHEQCVQSAPVVGGNRIPFGLPVAAAEAAGQTLLVYADETRVYACYGTGSVILNPSGEPADLTAPVQEFAAYAAAGGRLVVVGRTPPGVTGVDVLLPDGRAFRGEVAAGLFYLWQAIEGSLSGDARQDVIVRFSSPGQVTLRRQTTRAGEGCDEALNELPLPGTKSSAPALQFTFGEAEGAPQRLFGDSETMVRCGALPEVAESLVIDVSYRPQGPSAEPFEQLHDVELKRGYVFGRAPAGAVSGEVTLRGGRTVQLSIKDGFYAAYWSAEDDRDAPVRVRIDTDTHRWVYEDGTTTRTVR